MRILLLLLLSVPAFSQQITFKKASYYFLAPGSAPGSWWRSVQQSVTVTIDTAAKTITIPNFQMWETISSKKNLINNVVKSMAADTSLSIIQPNVVYKIVEPVRKLPGVDAWLYALEGRASAALVCGDFSIEFPEWNNWVRGIAFKNE